MTSTNTAPTCPCSDENHAFREEKEGKRKGLLLNLYDFRSFCREKAREPTFSLLSLLRLTASANRFSFQVYESCLDMPVLIDDQIAALKVTVHNGRTVCVKVEHPPRRLTHRN